MEGDGGVDAAFDNELAQDQVPSPSRVDLPRSMGSLDLQMCNVTTLLDDLEWQWHEDYNEVIAFMNDLQHNQWYILD